MRWVARVEANRGAFAELLTWDPFRDWDRLVMIESRVEGELFRGLELAYARGLSDPSANAFFQRARSVAERTIAEDRLESPPCATRFPKNRGTLHRAYAYARALLGGSLDRQALLRAADDFLRWCDGYSRGRWDSQAQAYYLAAIRLVILGGDEDRLERLLSTRKSFAWHREEHALWKQLAAQRAGTAPTEEFGISLDAYFQKFKYVEAHDVFVESDVLRLELAAIRYMYREAEWDAVCWETALAYVDQ